MLKFERGEMYLYYDKNMEIWTPFSDAQKQKYLIAFLYSVAEVKARPVRHTTDFKKFPWKTYSFGYII